jgi:hypothetical protein
MMLHRPPTLLLLKLVDVVKASARDESSMHPNTRRGNEKYIV